MNTTYYQNGISVNDWAVNFLSNRSIAEDYLALTCYDADNVVKTFVFVGDITYNDTVYTVDAGATCYICTNNGQVTSYDVEEETNIYTYYEGVVYSNVSPLSLTISGTSSANTDLPLLTAFVIFATTFGLLYMWRSLNFSRRAKT